MKIDRHGRSKILTPQEIEILFDEAYSSVRDRALYAVMLFTACRVSEAITLKKRDVYDLKGRVRPEITIRKGNTKGKLATRAVPVIEDLRYRLEVYTPRADSLWLFPGNEVGPRAASHLHKDSAMWLLRRACRRAGIEGVSSHSFRRTALTQMSNAGIPLRVIQEVSGHRTLDELYKYLEVKEEQVRGAVASLSMLSPPGVSSVKSLFDGWEKFLPEYVEPITSEVLLSWFAWGGLDAVGKFLGMWFLFNHGNFHMYNYLYLVRLKGMHTRKFLPFLRENPQFIEWAYTLTDAVYVVMYLVLDFLLPFISMIAVIYLFSWIGSGVAVSTWVGWGGAIVLPMVALSLYGFTQSIVRGAFHYSRLEQEVGENFDPSSW